MHTLLLTAAFDDRYGKGFGKLKELACRKRQTFYPRHGSICACNRATQRPTYRLRLNRRGLQFLSSKAWQLLATSRPPGALLRIRTDFQGASYSPGSQWLLAWQIF
jgi:hypothetical protein